MDEWINTDTGSLRAFYICAANNRGKSRPCGTAMPSRAWGRKYAAITAKDQKWYCGVCGCRYNATWGMLVEISNMGGNPGSFFFLADCPTFQIEDIK